MTAMRLTLELYTSDSWWDVMHLEFEKPELGQNSPCSFAYDQHYLVDHLNALGSPTGQSVSARIPLSWDLYRTPGIPAFLLDILPAGAADPDELFDGLKDDARRLLALPDLLSEGGLPQQTFRHPRIALARLHPTFRAWGLA